MDRRNVQCSSFRGAGMMAWTKCSGQNVKVRSHYFFLICSIRKIKRINHSRQHDWQCFAKLIASNCGYLQRGIRGCIFLVVCFDLKNCTFRCISPSFFLVPRYSVEKDLWFRFDFGETTTDYYYYYHVMLEAKRCGSAVNGWTCLMELSFGWNYCIWRSLSRC